MDWFEIGGGGNGVPSPKYQYVLVRVHMSKLIVMSDIAVTTCRINLEYG